MSFLLTELSDWAVANRISGNALCELMGILNKAAMPSGKLKKSNGREGTISNQIRAMAANQNSLLWRNNSGVWSDIYNGRKRYIRYGLGNDSAKVNAVLKSSDLIGITPLTIEPQHIGRTWGVFTAIEVKHEEWEFSLDSEHSVAQDNFLRSVKLRGGIGGFTRSTDDFLTLLTKFYNEK